jgi:hypothetical protein
MARQAIRAGHVPVRVTQALFSAAKATTGGRVNDANFLAVVG